MTKIPDNIVYIMGVDNAGNVVNIDATAITAPQVVQQVKVESTSKGKKVPQQQEESTPQVQVVNTETTVKLSIDAEPNYVPIVKSDKENLINSIIYQSGTKIGVGTKIPKHKWEIFAGSYNINTNKVMTHGYKINGYNIAFIDTTDEENGVIFIGDDVDIKTVSIYELLLRGLELEVPTLKNRILVSDDLGNVTAVEDIYLETINNLAYKAQSIEIGQGLLVDDVVIESEDDDENEISIHTIQIPSASLTKRGVLTALDYKKFDDKQDAITLTPNMVVISDSLGKITQSSISTAKLDYLANVDSDIQAQLDSKFELPLFNDGSVIFSNGTTLVQDNANFRYDDVNNRLVLSNLYVPVIGNPTGVSAQNSWTFGSNVTLATGIVPTLDQHFVTKKYVDDISLTGLRLGAEVKTVSASNITLSGNQTINGYTTIAGDRILVIGQSTASQNGIYIASSSSWSRATDSDSDAELRGYQYLITAGNEAGARYGNTNTTAITVGTTSITYQKISGQETDPIFTASAAAGITATSISNWNTAFSRSLPTNSLSITGTTTKTITLTRQDATTISAQFTETVQSLAGTTDRITVGTAPNYAINISPNYAGQSTITTLGTVTTGTWNATAIVDAYIASAATWNAKQNAITGAATTITTANLDASLALISNASGKVAVSAVTATELSYLSGVSGAIQSQINGKQGTLTLTTTGTSGVATLVGNTLNIPNYQSGVVSFNGRAGAVSPTEGDYSLTSLSDVNIVTPAVTQYLRYNGSQWVNMSLQVNDIIGTLGFTPIASYTEVDTLQSVTSRGNVTTTFIEASYFKEGSDIRKKIVLATNPLIDANSIDVIKFHRIGGGHKVRFGYSAQDVYDVIPDVVDFDDSGFMSVNYSDVHTLKIAQLERRVAELEEKLGING